MPGVARPADVPGPRGRHGRRRLDGRERRDRRALRGPRFEIPPGAEGQRRARRGPQHRRSPRVGRVPRLRGQRRRRPASRLRVPARSAGRERLRLRVRERSPAHVPRHAEIGVPVQGVRANAPPHAHHPLPTAPRGSDCLEQALPAFVLGPQSPELPRGRPVRGHPGHDPCALPGEVRRRRRADGVPVADAGGRRPVDHAAPRGDEAAAGSRCRRRLRQPVSRRAGIRGLEGGLRPYGRRQRPSLLPRRAAPRGRRVPAAVPRPRQRVHRPGRQLGARPAAGDRPAEVGARTPSRAAGAPRGASLRGRESPRRAAGAGGTALLRRLSLPKRRAAADSLSHLPAGRRALAGVQAELRPLGGPGPSDRGLRVHQRRRRAEARLTTGGGGRAAPVPAAQAAAIRDRARSAA